MMRKSHCESKKKHISFASYASGGSTGGSVASRKKKPVKVGKASTRLREIRETKKLFDSVAKQLLQDRNSYIHSKLEQMCADIIARKMAEMRQDLIVMDSTFSARISDMESKLEEATKSIAEVTRDLLHQNTAVRDDVTRITAELNKGIETERAKRIASFKKLQLYEDAQINEVRLQVAANKEEGAKEIAKINGECKKTRETMEELLLKRYGFVPDERVSADNLNASFQRGVEAGAAMDNVEARLRNIESHIAEETGMDVPPFGLHGGGLESSFHQHSRNIGSPLKQSVHNFGRSMANNKVRRIEEYIYELRGQVQELEADLQQVKSTVVSRFRAAGGTNGIGSPLRNDHYDHGAEPSARHHTKDRDSDRAVERNKEDIRVLQKKLKKLAENTTRACRSLSGGLNDVQQATLNLYSWSDVAHDAFGKVSHQLGFQVNVCPRARVYSPTHEIRKDEPYSFY